MNINMNSPNNQHSISFYTVETYKDTQLLKQITGKKLTETLAKMTNDQALPNIAIRKGDVFIMTKENLLENRKIVLIDNGKRIDLTGRVRVMNEADVIEIKQFAAQYFARMKEGEEKVAVKTGSARIWQPAKESDKKKGDAARRAITSANERYEEQSGKENRSG